MPPLPPLKKTSLAVAMAHVLAVPGAQAASIVVNNSGDAIPSTSCTLREAVALINDPSLEPVSDCSNSGAGFGSNDQISFSQSIPQVNISAGRLDIEKDLTINGDKTGTTIRGNGSSKLLNMYESGTTITLNNLIISNGGGVVLVVLSMRLTSPLT